MTARARIKTIRMAIQMAKHKSNEAIDNQESTKAEEAAVVTEINEDGQNEPEIERTVIFEEALEAILFAAGHPVKYASIAKVLGLTPSATKDKVFEYALQYNKSAELARGVMLLTFSDSCQLCTKENYLPEIREALGIRKSGSLSTAAMETLAVVAYNQPVTRVFVDTIRKVDSSYAMNSLIDRGLIECVGRLDVPGRPMQYGITSDFLRCFGMKSIDDLPAASEDLINMFDKVRETEEAERAEEMLQMSIDELDVKSADEEGIEADTNIPGTNATANDDGDDGDSGASGDGTDTDDGDGSGDDDGPSADDDIIDID